MAAGCGRAVPLQVQRRKALPTTPRRLAAARTSTRLGTGLLGLSLAITAWAPATPHAAAAEDPTGGLEPTIHYEEALRHAGDTTSFEPGGRVTVGFVPRAGDTALVGGAAPRALPAGRLTGRELRRAAATPVGPIPTEGPVPAADPAAPTQAPVGTPSPQSTEAAPSPAASELPDGEPSATPPSAAPSDEPALDQPSVDPESIIVADPIAWTGVTDDGGPDLAAEISPSGLRKEVFGFLPYWEVSDSSLQLDYAKLSTIAFFGVGASATGGLEKTTSSGSTTVGWNGWTSARMTQIINDAHRNNTRVVLTVQSFAWSTAGANKQKALLGSSGAQAALARNIVAAIRDRGADGVNLDFEPIAPGYAEAFTSLVRSVRAELDNVRKGYQLTFDTTGSIGNYPIEAATASGGADAILIMGYDYRQAGSSTAGSIAPLRRSPGYDILETLEAYTDRVPASKLILGVPWYGRAWSTATDDLRSTTTTGTKYGASSSVTYSSAVGYLADHGRRYDAAEQVAWTAYQRENCSSTYGCVTGWRQLYVDDAEAMRAKYDLVNQYGLRGAGIWALGYDGTRGELWTAIRDRFVTDSNPPRVGVNLLAGTQATESFSVAWTSDDDFGVRSHDVEVSIDGGAWARWLSGTGRTSANYVGARGHAFAFRVRARDFKGNVSGWSSATNTTTVATSATLVSSPGAEWYPVAPVRLLDTRTGNGLSGAFRNATVRTFQLTGRGGLPADAVAVTANLTVTGATTSGYVSVGPTMDSTPTTSTLNFSSGQTAANGLTLRIGSGGKVGAVFRGTTTSSRAHLVLDVTGYYKVGGTGASWYPLTPTRLLDTRVGTGLSGRFKTRVARNVQIAGRGSIPSDVVAVTGNLTAVSPTGSGYVSAGPTMTSHPTTSTLNLAKGTTRANNLTLRLGAGGKAGLVFVGPSGTAVHLVFDVTGYYRTGNAGAEWYPVTPVRLLDTRVANGLSGAFADATVRRYQLTGRGSVPVDAVAVTANLTATGGTSAGYISVGPTMDSTPTTSTLNVATGQTAANGLTLRVGAGGTVGAVFRGGDDARIHQVMDLVGYFR